ncbi:hypothetical protein [Streptomyces sp. NPDC020607]|uniref:hypothetical protein n=1 Tax=Streptomyces sp. NPDC020607 TaxID=3365082 RepID=UPI003791D33B
MGLAEEQVCGRRCVWCAASLNNGTAIDLGAREVDTRGGGARWFPRACRPCAHKHFGDAHQAHRDNCTQCSTTLPWCTTGQRLFAAAMKADPKARR